MRWLIAPIIVGACLFAGPHAKAALVTCPEPGFTTEPGAKVQNAAGNATATVTCQYLVPPDQSNVATIANINAGNFFGDALWQSNGATNTQVGPGGPTGTWSINSPDFAHFDYAIFFKDGNATNLIGFVFNELFTSGVWSTPFTAPPFSLTGNSTSHDVSDFTIARTPIADCPDCGVNPLIPTPEPSTIALLAVGLLGLGAMARFTNRPR